MQLSIIDKEVGLMEHFGRPEEIEWGCAVPGSVVICETVSSWPEKPRLPDRLREAVRTRHYSRRTKESYIAWIRRFILFHGKRHRKEMGEAEMAAFLSALA